MVGSHGSTSLASNHASFPAGSGGQPATDRCARDVASPHSVLLPAALVTGGLLSKHRAWGFCLAPLLLTGLVLPAVGIVTLMAVLECGT
jgi:hypothetical protein